MSTVDKNAAVIAYIKTCPTIANSPLFFNFAEGEINNKAIVTTATDKAVEPQYIDGSVLKRYTFTLIDYRGAIYQALASNQTTYPNQNVAEMLNIQGIIDWVNTQNKARNFPNFGTDCIIDEIVALTEDPVLNGIDKSSNVAKYSVAFRITYLDRSECLW